MDRGDEKPIFEYLTCYSRTVDSALLYDVVTWQIDEALHVRGKNEYPLVN
ncbi:uncharacterized protein PHALS_10362 [Plasmopara halstedii]|uniref:Uncharacterized protein n=1 Tax=Plasmopara halstedii TaxID=4781 RepID=A0A0P1AI24_PLAHL|nr:uncharacterized protein PHALS_10362 [Plasmopara halstedii]CEG40148.1 hypothetical protein PHALS_10362 [Plasmopara halstedii]|eukprot:XP_024576517.1 hypothetical protein PHALS_10362 [Plasmopara halstedii]